MALTVDTVDRIEAISTEWERLADRTSAWPDLHPGFLAAWWRSFGRGRLRIFTARRDGRLAGLLPMARDRSTLSSPTSWETSRFGFLAEDGEAAEALARALFEDRPRKVRLAFVPADDVGMRPFLDAAAAARYRTVTRTVQRSPFVALNGDWEAFRGTLTSSRLRELRRRRRRLEERGRLRLEILDGTERLDELLEEGFAVEASGWKSDERTAIASRPETRRFYAELSAWAARRGWLRLAFLRLDRRPLAFDLCLEARGVHFLLKTGFDIEFRQFAPGLLMRHDMLARAFSEGLRRYEFLGGDDPWKLEWTQTCRELLHVQAHAPTPGGTLSWAAAAYARPILRRAYLRVRRAGKTRR